MAKRLSVIHSRGPVGATESDYAFLMQVAKASHAARLAQKAYFASRSKSDLIASKDAESKLDNLLNETVDGPEQPTLTDPSHDLPEVRKMEVPNG